MAENEEYIIPDAIAEETNLKTVEVYIHIPGLEVKWKLPGIGTAELKNNCTVPNHIFNKTSLEVVAVVTSGDGMEKRYKYFVQKLPGEIIPEECKIKYKDGQITLVLAKKISQSWEIQIKKGLEQTRD